MTETNFIPADSAEEQDGAKLVPVAESIKYRRRAQQAEARLQELEQQLSELQSQVKQQDITLSNAQQKNQQSEQTQTELKNRLMMERQLSQAGAVDIDTAAILLGNRLDLSQVLDARQINQAIGQLLEEKSFLRKQAGPDGLLMPPMSNGPRNEQIAGLSGLATAAERATQTGNRRDMAEYLRLRRQLSNPLNS